eukprot:Nk52_evm32s248 gene=Nk52_evmTU32s248
MPLFSAKTLPYPANGFNTVEEFYPFYLGEHMTPENRKLHVAGTATALTVLAVGLAKRSPKILGMTAVFGYGFAWAGHYFFEKNKPATFKHPFLSFCCDFIMFYELVSGQRPFDERVEATVEAVEAKPETETEEPKKEN